ncbi:minor capsid protein [Metaclostridioides mangenotii]|uniref:minor capsid protein n=1 Tax=Metaclostridioides mangenotii TaxID=1540 RepID=UPI0028EB21CA|nr:minor capsid protein [Clostridioides mangenotii]
MTGKEKIQIGLFLYFALELYKQGEKESKEQTDEQKKDREKFLKEIALITIGYKLVDNKLKLSIKDEIRLKRSLNRKIDSMCSLQADKEARRTRKLIARFIEDKYNSSNYILQLGKMSSNRKLSRKVINKILYKTIDGKNFSDRIYSNKKATAKVLRKEVKNFLKGKTTIQDIEKRLNKKFDTNEFNTRRLVEHEVERVQNAVDEVWRTDNGIEEVLYSAIMDKVTCPDCDQYDQKTYKISEIPVELPQHLGCRCIYIAIIRNWNGSNRDISWESYKKW